MEMKQHNLLTLDEAHKKAWAHSLGYKAGFVAAIHEIPERYWDATNCRWIVPILYADQLNNLLYQYFPLFSEPPRYLDISFPEEDEIPF